MKRTIDREHTIVRRTKDTEPTIMRRLVSLVVGALSAVNHRGLHQGSSIIVTMTVDTEPIIVEGL